MNFDKKFQVNFLMQNNISRGLALLNCCKSLTILQVFTPLYRGVKETL